MKLLSALRIPGLAVLVVALAGCGTKTARVSGTVTFQNKPLAVAKIYFINEKGKTVEGDVVDGKFDIPNVPVGESIKVQVSTQHIKEMLSRFHSDAAIQKQMGVGQELQGLKDKLPTDELPEHLRQTPSGMPADFAQHIKMMEEKYVELPMEFQIADKTPLKIKVASGSQEIVIDLDKGEVR